jgi:bifunctional non-homologous end joining protein LigD
VSPPTAALATLRHQRFYAAGWLYERKLDGERCLAEKHAGGVRLWSRSGREVSSGFPEVVQALEAQDGQAFVVDGEIVAFDGTRTSFAKLQPRIHVADPRRARATGIAVWYYLFDVLEAGGDDVRRLPLRRRKGLLRSLVSFGDPLRYTVHRNAADEEYFQSICRRGWEGLVVKRADSPYVGGRSASWLKFKCEAGQELVVGGFTDPEGSRVGLGALLLGYYDAGVLTYAGKVGTGFDNAMLTRLAEELRRREVDQPPFGQGRLPRGGVHWVRPELVAAVAFTEWTRAGQLRHPRFLGLRRDKAAEEVVRE